MLTVDNVHQNLSYVYKSKDRKDSRDGLIYTSSGSSFHKTGTLSIRARNKCIFRAVR